MKSVSDEGRRGAAGAPKVPARAVKPDSSRVRAVIRTLARLYPDAKTALHFQNPYELLVATVLSAQCTDERVNQVTPAFFARFPDATALARGSAEEIERLIYPTGFFRNKTRSLRAAGVAMVERHAGQVPGTLDDLVALPGIGRKTANVILGNAFGIPGITVDTHVARLSQRLGWSRETDPVKIERDLMALIPRAEWTSLSLRLIEHGRRICVARKPRCPECALLSDCPTGTALMGLVEKPASCKGAPLARKEKPREGMKRPVRKRW